MYTINLVFYEDCDPRKKYRFIRVLAKQGFNIYDVNKWTRQYEPRDGKVTTIGGHIETHADYCAENLPDGRLIRRILANDLVKYEIKKS